MPDQFSGDTAPNSASVDTKLNPDPPLLERIKLGVAETAKSFMLDMWVSRYARAISDCYFVVLWIVLAVLIHLLDVKERKAKSAR